MTEPSYYRQDHQYSLETGDLGSWQLPWTTPGREHLQKAIAAADSGYALVLDFFSFPFLFLLVTRWYKIPLQTTKAPRMQHKFAVPFCSTKMQFDQKMNQVFQYMFPVWASSV
jgi:hypothetical protein